MPSPVELDNVFITDAFDDWSQERPSKRVGFVNKILRRLGTDLMLAPPISTGSMTSVEQRSNMFHLVTSVLVYGVPGDFAELGCNTGQSSVMFKKLLDHYDPSRSLHVYDSFEGLPEVKPEDGDTNFKKGQIATTKDVFLANFKKAGLEPPVIHQGWFDDVLPTELPDQIAFAYLDGDLYDSIKVSLEHVYPKLSPGAVCLIDDYADRSVFDSVDFLPGVKKACDEFLADKPEKVAVMYGGFNSRHGFGSHGFFRKH